MIHVPKIKYADTIWISWLGCGIVQYGYFILNPPSNSETTNRNGMNFKPLIEELKCPPFTKFGVKRMIGLVTVHVLRFCSYLAAAVESADQF